MSPPGDANRIHAVQRHEVLEEPHVRVARAAQGHFNLHRDVVRPSKGCCVSPRVCALDGVQDVAFFGSIEDFAVGGVVLHVVHQGWQRLIEALAAFGVDAVELDRNHRDSTLVMFQADAPMPVARWRAERGFSLIHCCSKMSGRAASSSGVGSTVRR